MDTSNFYHWEQAHTEADQELVYKFRYQHYFAKAGNLPGVDHLNQRVYSEHDAVSVHFLVRDQADKLLAVCTITPGTAKLNALWQDIFQIERLKPLGLHKQVIISKLIVTEEHRNSDLFGKFFIFVANYCLEHGFTYALHYCSMQLVPLYQRLGYRLYGQAINLPSTNEPGYLRLPMILATYDYEYLRKIRSVFLQTKLISTGCTQQLLEVLPELRILPLCTYNSIQRLAMVRKLADDPTGEVIPNAAMPALRHAAIIELPSGSQLPSQHSEGTLFILNGVLKSRNDCEQSSILLPGRFIITGQEQLTAITSVQILTFYKLNLTPDQCQQQTSSALWELLRVTDKE